MREAFEDSRRLTGINPYFARPGAVLEAAPGLAVDADRIARWESGVAAARNALGWPAGPTFARAHASGATLAFAAPPDQLYAATEVNEWAWEAALGEATAAFAQRLAPGHAAAWDRDGALATLRALAAAEAQPALTALLDAAAARALPALLDDQVLTLGEGSGARSWPREALPAPAEVPWARLHAIPVALVTGSNGKTTTTRLTAAMLDAHGLVCGYSSTDGVVVAGRTLEDGDYSGPGGARAVLRDGRVQAAVLETARGGILRRGLAVTGVQAALVTNVSADHFGEYGIHDLDDLTGVKLVVGQALADDGVLVLNADDTRLRAHAQPPARRLGWFALDADQPLLAQARAAGRPVCGARDGRLMLGLDGAEHDLGEIAAMPLSVGGRARYNIANLAGAAVLAAVLGVAPATIGAVLGRFGRRNADNLGRLMRWSLGGASVWLDYAHNPAGLEGLIGIARGVDGPRGRLALVLGQAGNREDADIRALAATAARFAPDLVVLKDIESHLRGRASGEIAAILGDELQRRGVPAAALQTCLDEVEAVRTVLRWAHAGDSLVLPVHDASARAAAVDLLDRLADLAWQPGQPLPEAG
ncbi:MAG TPA: Mur ligase family protein [Dokdonella sp.]|uniref:Mur ligase family protein n=1 Tax=Dokdonella sp. TaxID=2291710 RepID=UPI002BCB58D6|nr:Mur ligase family protein [Dokdonella sp.]HUD43772.1 Mur ligase family protein [Dokdonella sp.]